MAQKITQTIRRIGYKMLNGEKSTVKWLPSMEAGGREYTAEPKGESTSIYADGIKVYATNPNDGYDITLTLLAVIDDVSTEWLNEKKDAKGIAEYADGKEFPYFSLFIMEETSDGVGKTTIFPRCQCTARLSLAGKTSEGSSFDTQFPQYKIAASPREEDKLVRYTIAGQEEFTTVPEPITTSE